MSIIIESIAHRSSSSALAGFGRAGGPA